MAEILDQAQLVKDAQDAYRASNFLKAAALYKATQESFKTAGDSLKAAEMANNCSVALLRANDADGAFQVIAGVEGVFETAGDIRGWAITLGNRAAAQESLGRRDEALRDYQKSTELFRQIGGHELYTTTMQSLSALQLRTGRSLEALATMLAGIDVIERPNIRHRILKRILGVPYRLLNR